MKITYRGDVARLFRGAELIDDQFWYGPEWTVGLKRFKEHLHEPFVLTLLPLRTDAPIYIDAAHRPSSREGEQIAELQSVTLVPEYELILHTAPAKPTSSAH